MNWRNARLDPPDNSDVQFALGHANAPMTAVYRDGQWFRCKYGHYGTRVDGITWWCSPTKPPTSFLDGVKVSPEYAEKVQNVLGLAESKG